MEDKPVLFGNLIVGDFESPEMLKRCIDSFTKYVDGLYIAITYKDQPPPPTHPLVKLLKLYKANISYFKWVKDFAAARNFIMDQTPHGENIYLFWIDADDVLLEGENLRFELEEAYRHKIAAVFFTYLYQVEMDENNNIKEIIVEHKRERIIRNDHSFKWIGALHETLIEQQTENVQKVLSRACRILHLSNADRIDSNIDRNIEILEQKAREENHKDPRTLIYLGKAYLDKAKFGDQDKKKINFDLALMLFNEYLEGVGIPGKPGHQEGSGWAEERAIAWASIAEIAMLNEKYNVAERALHNAIIEAPEFPNYYVDLAMVLASKQEYRKAKHWLNIATTFDMPETTIVTAPRDLKTRALETDYSIAISEGDLERAKKDSEKLIEIMPKVEGLKERHQILESLIRDNKASQSVVFLGKYLEEAKEPQKLPYLVQAIPNALQQEQFASEMKHKFLPERTWANNEIAILCGPGFEQWSPKSLKTGLGGSEEAVVYLSRELTKLGWKVTVYANPMGDVGNHEGVEYKQWYDLNIKDRFNILILWRIIGLVDFNPKARYIMMWAHDVPSNPDINEQRLNKIDKIAVLSEYHKSLFRMSKDGQFLPIPDEKFLLTTNGIPQIKLPKKEIKRNPYRCIWTSSYDRGLVHLLQMWSDIKKEVPEAELHIYYGWNLYDAIHRNNPARMQWKAQMVKLMDQEGIFEHGRVGHEQLNEEFMKSGIFSYYCTFEEISTISAMKAQAYGAIPVVTNYAALKETVKNGLKIEGSPFTTVTQEAYKKALIELLKDHKQQEEIRGEMMKWAREYFLWEKVAKQWVELFDANLKISLPKQIEAEKGEKESNKK